MKAKIATGAWVLTMACGGSKAAPPKLEPTLSWSAPASMFSTVNMGAVPAKQAQAFMGSMPTLTHKVGEACRTDPGLRAASTVFVQVTVAGGQPTAVSVEPPTLAWCLEGAFRKHAAVLRRAPDATVGLWMKIDASATADASHAPEPS